MFVSDFFDAVHARPLSEHQTPEPSATFAWGFKSVPHSRTGNAVIQRDECHPTVAQPREPFVAAVHLAGSVTAKDVGSLVEGVTR